MIVPERDSSKSIGALFKDQFGFSQSTFPDILSRFFFFCWWDIYVNDRLSYPVYLPVVTFELKSAVLSLSLLYFLHQVIKRKMLWDSIFFRLLYPP